MSEKEPYNGSGANVPGAFYVILYCILAIIVIVIILGIGTGLGLN